MALRHFAARAAGSLGVRCHPPSPHSRATLPLARYFSTILENLKYAPSHEWVRVEGDDVAYLGISDHAQSQLGDVVHVDVQASKDESVTKGSVFAVVESVKAASDVYAPVSGTVVEVNENLDGSKNPELVNSSPYENGWFAKIKLTDPKELDDLLNSKAYEEHVQASEH